LRTQPEPSAQQVFLKNHLGKKFQKAPYFFTAHIVSSSTFNNSLMSRHHSS